MSKLPSGTLRWKMGCEEDYFLIEAEPCYFKILIFYQKSIKVMQSSPHTEAKLCAAFPKGYIVQYNLGRLCSNFLFPLAYNEIPCRVAYLVF